MTNPLPHFRSSEWTTGNMAFQVGNRISHTICYAPASALPQQRWQPASNV